MFSVRHAIAIAIIMACMVASNLVNAAAEEKEEVADAIIFAAAAGDVEHTKELLKTHDIHSVNKFGETALHVAAIHFKPGELGMVKLLLERGADVNQMTNGEYPGHEVPVTRSPLMWFVPHCDVEVTQLLLDHGADVLAEAEDGLNSIEMAEDHGERCQAVVDLLEEYAASHHDEL